MPRSAKGPNSRAAFAAIFEEQTRRFSAFDLLGLSHEALGPSPPNDRTALPAAIAPESAAPQELLSQAQALVPDRQAQAFIPDEPLPTFPPAPSEAPAYTPPATPINEHSGQFTEVAYPAKATGKKGKTRRANIQSQSPPLRPDHPLTDRKERKKAQALVPDRRSEALRPDGQVQGLTVRPEYFGPTGEKDLYLTPVLLVPDPPALVPDRQAEVTAPPPNAILLAPIQWAVWIALKEAEKTGRLLSYRQLAKEIRATPDGVKKAVFVIQKEGGISAKEIVRTAREQGFRITTNPDAQFRPGTLNEGKGVLKRGVSFGLTGGGQAPMLRPDGRSMYVCNIFNSNIKQTDMAKLLRLAPPEWRVREQTLMQIAESLPDMTAIEFRLSLAYLVDQAKNAKEPIRNPNAWIKAAFEKNGGPLVTEREIEARLEQTPLKRDVEKTRSLENDEIEELALLRRYLAATSEDRAEIDRIAAEKAAPLLKIVAEDKRTGVMEQARVEAARAFFAQKLAETDAEA
jgi:hypothetical protein